MSRYKQKIPRDDLKRFGKEIAKKLVNSDYKAGRVKDPTKIDEKQQKKVKVFCKDYFEKAAQKHKKHEAEKLSRSSKKDADKVTKLSSAKDSPSQSPNQIDETHLKLEASDDEDIKMSDNDLEPDETSGSSSAYNSTLKRKRPQMDNLGIKDEDDSDILQSPAKKLNFDSEATSPRPPPPPPPAPPAETPPDTGTPIQEAGEDEMDTDLHADTNFKGKSMADVLAQAQQEGDDEMDNDYTSKPNRKLESPETKFEEGLGTNGVKMENPMTDGQDIVERIKEEVER
jgi:hypothetical protein